MIKVMFLLFLSFVASPALFVNKFPRLNSFYNQLSVYRAIIGVIYLGYGLLSLVEVLIEHAAFMSFITSIVTIGLGFLLGFQWIKENIFTSNQLVKERLNRVHTNLIRYEANLSIVVLVLAIYYLINLL